MEGSGRHLHREDRRARQDLTAASGEYESTLVSEMDKEDAPTLFQCNEGGVATWGEFCYDLSSSDVYNQLTSKDYVLKNADGEVISIGYCLRPTVSS